MYFPETAAAFPLHKHAFMLTNREIEIVQLIADGNTDREIGEKLSISGKTVSTHRKNILRKLDMKNTAMLIRYAMSQKLVR